MHDPTDRIAHTTAFVKPVVVRTAIVMRDITDEPEFLSLNTDYINFRNCFIFSHALHIFNSEFRKSFPVHYIWTYM